MNNARRRREVLILMVLASEGYEAMKAPNANVAMMIEVFKYLPHLQTSFERAVVSTADKNAELELVRKLVNQISYGKTMKCTPTVKLWYAGQFIVRMIAAGFKPPHNMMEQGFVQALYNLGNSFVVHGEVVPDNVIRDLPMVPVRAKRLGFFIPA